MTPTSDTERRVFEALRRAAHRARQTAAQTRTEIVVVRDGVLVAEKVDPAELVPRPDAR